MSGRPAGAATAAKSLDPRDARTVRDLADALWANEPAVVVSRGGGGLTLALGGADLPPELLDELVATCARFADGLREETLQ